jgi:TonB family protein
VTDARVLSGPPDLRTAALRSALEWHFAAETSLPPVIPVTVQFRLTPSTPASALPNGAMAVQQILFTDLSEAIKDKLLHDMPVRVGDSVTADSLDGIGKKLAAIDEHLGLTEALSTDGSLVLTIALRQPHQTAPAAPLAETTSPQRIRVGGNVQATMLVKKITPKYPPLAKAARIQGKVRYSVVIGKDGTVQSIDLVFGHPLLAEAATPALKQWVYKPTLLNGEPVEVATQVDVNFTLL